MRTPKAPRPKKVPVPKAPRIAHPKEVPEAEWFKAENRAAADKILQNPPHYGGEDSLAVRWAHMILEGYEPTEKHWGLVA